jgi:hypothetical protein
MANGIDVQVDVSRLHLDSENPRHDPITDEPEIISRLYGLERVLVLAKSIAKNGTSPLERMAVIEHPDRPGHFIVVEGNRRLCALKLLRDPQKAPTPGGRRSLEEAKRIALDLPKKLDVVKFADREAARVWISIRHEGEQQGAGTKKWSADQKTRHDRSGARSTNPNVQALALVEYALASGLVSQQQRDALSLTTLTRYLGNPIFRHTLGLANKLDVTIDVAQDEFNRALQRFLLDALPAPGATAAVNSRSNQKEWKAYAQTLKDAGLAPHTRLPAPVAATPKPSEKPKPSGGRHSTSPDKRAKVVPSEFKVAIADRVLKRVFDELRIIDPELFPFSAGYLLRAFVEQTAHLYAKKHALGHEGQLNQVIGRCVAKLQADGAAARTCKPLNEMSSDKHSRLSPDGLGAWVHGSVIPTGAELKRRWDAIEAGFRLMLEAL